VRSRRCNLRKPGEKADQPREGLTKHNHRVFTFTAVAYHIVFSTEDRVPKRQGEHHRKTTFEEQYRKLLAETGIEFDERHLF
jgi:hypothetical protein